MIHVSNTWDKNKLQSEEKILSDLIATADLSDADRDTIVDQATHLIDAIRTQSKPGLMEVFLATTTILLLSMPRLSTKSFVIALSDSK